MSDDLLGVYFKVGENWHKASLVKSEFSKTSVCSISTCWSLRLTCVHPFQSEWFDWEVHVFQSRCGFVEQERNDERYGVAERTDNRCFVLFFFALC